MTASSRDLLRFYVGLVIVPALFGAFMLGTEILIERSGEYLPLADIRARLEKSGGVYSSALDSRLFWLKQEIYRHVKPDIAVLGSSRVLQFRSQFFARPFANLGNMHNFDDVTEMARSMFTEHAPKVLILGIDFWWFSPVYHNLEYTRSPKQASVRSSDIFQTAGWILSGKISFPIVRQILKKSSPNLGIQGITTGQGIDASGSYIHTAMVYGTIPHYDVRFKEVLDRVARNQKMFSYSQHPSPEKLEKLDQLLSFLSGLGTRVIIVVPPLAPTAIDAMMPLWASYSYIPAALSHLKRKAGEYGMPYFDFHDPRGFGSSDCEMLDGIHGGPVAYARMLKRIAGQESAIRSFLNLPYVEDSIKTHAGRASLLGSGEVDFLKIGCQK